MERPQFFGEPYSTTHLSASTRAEILIMAALGILSSVTTFAVVAVIVHRLVVWRKEYRRFIRQNQCVVLVLNLFLADSIMGAGAALGFKWIQVGGILAPTRYAAREDNESEESLELLSADANATLSWCWAQAGLLHFGDLASGFFVLALGLQTLATFMLERAVSYERFCFGVVFVWVLALLLTIIGPLQHGAAFFVRTENWCWISNQYNFERLWLQYLWVFIVEFSTIVIYCGLFLHLHSRLSMLRAVKSTGNTPARVVTAMRVMALYPLAYVALTFPIAFSRMQILAGQKPSKTQITVAAALVASCGWVDAILYSFTRRILIHTGPEGSETLNETSDGAETPPPSRGSQLSDWPAPNSRRNSGLAKSVTSRIDPKSIKIEATTEIDVYEKEAEENTRKTVARMASASTMRRNWFPA